MKRKTIYLVVIIIFLCLSFLSLRLIKEEIERNYVVEMADLSTVSIEKLENILSNIMLNSSVEVKLESLKQICKQENYLKSEKGKEKSELITEILKDHYKQEKQVAVQEGIIGALLYAGKYEEVMPFFEEIAKDEKAPRIIKENIKLAIQILNSEQELQEKKEKKMKELERIRQERRKSDTLLKTE